MPSSSKSSTNGETNPQGPRVVVVGAGFAGVSAAAALREGGVEDVLVLEAQKQPGGRVQKIELDRGYVEPGAQFIHGETGNQLFELAEKYGLLMDASLYRDESQTSDSSSEDYLDHLFFTSRGEQVERDTVMRLIQFINRTWRDYSDIYFTDAVDKSENRNGGVTSPGEDVRIMTSNAEGITTDGTVRSGDCTTTTTEDTFGWKKDVRTFAELVEKVREKLVAENEAKELVTAVVKWVEQWEYTDNGARPSQLSLEGFGKFVDLPGYGLTVSRSGLVDIFRTLVAHSLPPHALLLGKVVKTIVWAADAGGDRNKEALAENGNSTSEVNREHPQSDLHQHEGKEQKAPPVRILCEDGEEFGADHVIVTSSIAYLQKHESNLFKPPLPESYKRALHRMGFGVVDKIFLVWDDLDQVLDPEEKGFQFLWLDTDHPKPPSDKTARKTQSGGNWYDSLQGFERISSHTGMLLTWIAGEEAAIMEELPEHEVRNVLYELLVQFTNKTKLPRPKQVIRTQWHSNPFILGAYSYIPVGMDLESHNLLTAPLPSYKNPLLQISGEGTSQRHYSTVHGAIESGQRAARAILRHHNKK